ncbi:hypothetical protein DPSP01_013094 [Paraphaeosphaeria sporulosa]
MNGTNGFNHGSPQPLAQRTCSQCKSSKKKCDKVLPKCGRCLRLSIDCLYPDLEKTHESETGNEANDSRFDEVFERLRRIEAQVFSPQSAAQNGTDSQRSLIELAVSHGVESPNPTNWTLEPGTLKPQYMSLILWQSILATLDEHKATIHGIMRVYITQTDQWLPMVSNRKWQKELALFGTLLSSDRFVLLALAMHLVVSPPADHPPAASLAESPWYRKCKYLFQYYVGFKEPNIEMVQAGMLIALFEFNQDIQDRALTTLGTCARLAYLLDFDEVMAKHAARNLGKLSADDEEASPTSQQMFCSCSPCVQIILTWMGITRLERYFNMPPKIMPKAQYMPLHFDNSPSCDCASPYEGPSVSNFSTVEIERLARCVYEYDAAQRLGRVQKFIRDNRYVSMSPGLTEKIRVILQDLEEYLDMRRAQMKEDSSWSGIHVVLGAAIQIQCFFIAAQGTLDPATMRSLHSYVDQLHDVISRCRTFHGFEENYLDGIQPTWCSLPYHAIRASRLIEEADTQGDLPSINMTLFVEVLQTMALKYKVAERCLELLELPEAMSTS